MDATVHFRQSQGYKHKATEGQASIERKACLYDDQAVG